MDFSGPCGTRPVSYTHLDVYKRQGSTDRNDLTEYEEKKENLGQGTLLIVDNPTRPENVGETSVVPQGTLPITPSISESSKGMEATKPTSTERLDLGEIVALPTLAYSPPAMDVYRLSLIHI